MVSSIYPRFISLVLLPLSCNRHSNHSILYEHASLQIGYLTSTKIKFFAAIQDIDDGSFVREAGLKALFVS